MESLMLRGLKMEPKAIKYVGLTHVLTEWKNELLNKTKAGYSRGSAGISATCSSNELLLHDVSSHERTNSV